jgi:hypothetical protein
MNYDNMNFSSFNQQTNYGTLTNSDTYNNLEKYQDHPVCNVKENKNADMMLKGHFTGVGNCPKGSEKLFHMFFSADNLDRIQKMIKKEIFRKTQGQYKLDTNQDDADLLVMMRAVFLEHSRFLPYRIVHQTKQLNILVINHIVPDMITEMKQEYSYIKEINEPIKPIPRPVNVNSAGRRTLPALTSAWNF